jgi:monothiol glutaredoxin
MDEEQNPFSELEAYKETVVYDHKDRKFYELMSYVSDDHIEIFLGDSEKLKIAMVEYFKIRELPVLLVYGTPVYANYKESIKQLKKKRDAVLSARIGQIIDPRRVTVFIKGTLGEPRCGFTRTLAGILREAGLRDGDIRQYDILGDEGVRQRLKEINEWPTYPQIYFKGEFVGGLDIIKKLHESGELRAMVEAVAGSAGSNR